MRPILTTAYLPSIEWMAWLAAGERIDLEAHENFQKQSMRNRTNILSANGKLALVVPVLRPSGEKINIKGIHPDENSTWRKDHIGAIQAAYQSSPFYEYYADPILEALSSFRGSLWDINIELVKILTGFFEIDTPIEETENWVKPGSTIHDFRHVVDKKQVSKLDFEKYPQVFSDKFSFVQNLSSIDLLFNQGPESKIYLNELIKTYLEKNGSGIQ